MPNHFEPNEIIENVCQKIIDNNPYGFILRPDLNRKTGGLLKSGHISNLDCAGKGIENRFKIGIVNAYPVDSVVKFLRAKMSVPAIKKRASLGEKTCQNLDA
jgi:hypothetical protein